MLSKIRRAASAVVSVHLKEKKFRQKTNKIKTLLKSIIIRYLKGWKFKYLNHN